MMTEPDTAKNTSTPTSVVREKRPSRSKALIFLVILAVVLFGLFLAASALRSKEGPKVAQNEPDPISVSVVPAEIATSFMVAETFTGIAEARRTSQLGFPSGGRIVSIHADVGDRVNRGMTLARLDTRGMSAQLASAEATVEEARASHRLALNTVERQRRLAGQGHVSQQRVDEAEAQAGTSMARIEAAKAQAETLRVQIDLMRISAPYNGVVTARMSDEGAIAAPGQLILQLVESDVLEARIGVPAQSAATLTPGETYSLRSDSGLIDAKLRSVTGVIDPGQRTVTCVFEIANPGRLAAGAVVRLALERGIDEGGFWVPVKALSTAQRGLWSVNVASPDEQGWRVRPRPVEMVHSDGDRAFVRGAVEAGDKIIVDGLQRVVPGMAVVPKDTAQAHAPKGG
jgi:RND family efflux transporter MFP subunit